MRIVVAAGAVLGLVLLSAAPGAAAERATATSEHYVVSTDGGQAEADDWARMLEAAWPQYAAWFGETPRLARGERLAVEVYDDDRPWRAAITARGGSAPSSGGYYCPIAKVAYLKRQPSAWYTRTLVLHEAAHQFHYLACTGNDTPAGSWYVEGVAEHLSSHTWDGETLRLGVTPLVSLEDRAGKALDAVARDGFSVLALVEAESAPRPESMFLVRYLAEEHGKRFTPLARKLDRGTALDGKAFRRAFGREEAFLDAWRSWLADRQEPFVSVFVEWDARGPDLLHGTAGVVSLCRTRQAADGIAATVRARGERPLRAGVLLAFTAPQDYVIGVVNERGSGAVLQVDRLSGGRWQRLGETDLGPKAPGGWRVEGRRGEDGVAVTATRAGEEGEAGRLGPLDLPATPMGLAFDACDAAFSGLRVRSTDAAQDDR